MAGKRSEWPDGMSDEEAVTRIQAVMIKACEGNRDLASDRDYKSVRMPLIRRADLSDVVPPFIRANRDLESMWAYLKGLSPHWKERREHVWESFRPLFDRVEGRTKPPVSSSNWTGRRTPTQQAAVVLSLAPDALHGVEMLLAEQERALHNGGPVDDAQRDALETLKELHRELGELISCAENGLPLDERLSGLRALKDKGFNWCKETYRLTLAESPLVASSTVLGCGVMMLVNAITQGSGEAGIAMGAAAMGVQSAAVLSGRKAAG